MGGEGSSSLECSRDMSLAPECLSGASGGPVRFLVLLHKAFRGELDEIQRAAENGWHGREVVLDELRRRLEFFRRVYKYHCAAEVEVLFVTLDARVENVACTYYLQHHSVDSMFESIFACLNGVMEDPVNPGQGFQELKFHIGTLRDSICQHMVKEEMQVFPLFTSHFSDEEQASLVLQFMCSLPVMVLEDLFPWLACFISPDEQLDLKNCTRNILSQDNALQEVVMSWIDTAARQSSDVSGKYETPSVCYRQSDKATDISELSMVKSSSENTQLKEVSQKNAKNPPLNGLLLWHAAIRANFREILDKLHQIESENFSSLSSVIFQIKFLNEVLIFYSDTLENIFHPMLKDTSLQQTSFNKSFPHKKEVEELQKILYDASQINLANAAFLEMLCSKVESLVLLTSEHLSFQEAEVFPLMITVCNHETQQKLLIKSLFMVPLGLLKSVVSWFSSHLPKDKLKSVLHGISETCFLDKPFASLLHEWVRTGYAGKTTAENLQEMFSSRVSYMPHHGRLDKDPSERSEYVMSGHFSIDSSGSFFSNSLSRVSGTNSVTLSPWPSYPINSFSTSPSEPTSEPRPMDHIYYFHKAIKKDLESLVHNTTKLSNNLGILVEFSQHFRLVRSLYELHSETEDKVAFPALEANPNARNLTLSYSIDHELETRCFERVSVTLDEMSELYHTVSQADMDPVDPALMKYHELCLKLEDSCKSLKKILDDHIYREETELWPLFKQYFSIEEQEQILGHMLGRTRPEILQKMMVWQMAHLTLDEQQAMMNFWRKATKYTKFDEWLGEWWKGMDKFDSSEAEKLTISQSSAVESTEIVSKYLSRGVSNGRQKYVSILDDDTKAAKMVKKMEGLDVDNHKHTSLGHTRFLGETKEKRRKEVDPIEIECNQLSKLAQEMHQQNENVVVSQDKLEATIRKVAQDSSLDLQEKTRVIQKLMTSHLVAAQPLPDSDDVTAREPGKFQGQFPSYRNTEGSVFGCRHYKQNCKLVATCCNRLFTCRRCHDEEVSDHVMDRKSTTQMMCMKCLEIQPIGTKCSTPSCNKYAIARYYCRICRLFDDEREIYHCPFCNLCRVGKGLGIDYFHCMKCNACMSVSLSTHTCREKCIEGKCPICQEELFASNNPIKSLGCGHVMHSTCFQEYTCMHYTCPVCSKSLGDMKVYFEMLDALLAEEKMPDEYRGQTQAILCNDCEKKATAPFHWLYHKCPVCGSYNTRLI